MKDLLTQTITLTVKGVDYEYSSSFTSEGGIVADAMFYSWLLDAFRSVGLPSVAEELGRE